MRKILFIDRDGTIVSEPNDEQVDRLDKIRFVDGVIPALLTLAAHGYELVLVTNQDGLGTNAFPEEDFRVPHQFIMELLSSQGIAFVAEHVDRSFPHDNLPTRKPGVGMLVGYLPELDRQNSWVIGDRDSDVKLAENLGIGAFKIGTNGCTWPSIVTSLTGSARTATLHRTTSETNIRATINLDQSTPVQINTGIGFFDHMLEQIARHGGFSLILTCEGDLQIDEHHSIEDAGLVLGSVLAKALGEKRGIGRFGFVLPMDESLAQIAIDLSGRPYLVFDAEFPREYVGGMPTEMVEHFFYSLAQTLGATVNISVAGDNAHHMVESIFKVFGRALRTAIARQADGTEIPSSKGTLSW